MIRYGASPGTVEALERRNMAIDVREVLPVVSAPARLWPARLRPRTSTAHAARSHRDQR